MLGYGRSPWPTVSLAVCAVAVVTVISPPSLVHAATIRGVVTDPTHALVAGAEVALRGQGTGFLRSTSTNTDGHFSFTDLAVGRYAIDVASPGFKTSVIRKIQLDVADARSRGRGAGHR